MSRMSLKETPINNPRVPPTEKSWPNAPSEIYYVMNGQCFGFSNSDDFR